MLRQLSLADRLDLESVILGLHQVMLGARGNCKCNVTRMVEPGVEDLRNRRDGSPLGSPELGGSTSLRRYYPEDESPRTVSKRNRPEPNDKVCVEEHMHQPGRRKSPEEKDAMHTRVRS